MARKEFSPSKQNKHTSIGQHNRVSNRYLHEFATFVLHPTLNYGPFNFTITDNGGGDAENQRFSSAVLRKWEKGTMKLLPTRCLSLSQPLWVLLGGSGENQGCPGSWSLGNETSGWKNLTTRVEGRSFRVHLSMMKWLRISTLTLRQMEIQTMVAQP